MMTPKRAERFREVVGHRQFDLTVVLENVHDPHNISAVLRSCDSVGIFRIFVLYTDPRLQAVDPMELGHKSSAGARRWVDVWYFEDPHQCFREVQKDHTQILGTHLSESAVGLHQLDLTASTALVFGNEKDGLSEETLQYCTGNFLIPQVGMVKSLNISVACAVSVYEAFRQRQVAGQYAVTDWEDGHEQLWQTYVQRHEEKLDNREMKRMD